MVSTTLGQRRWPAPPLLTDAARVPAGRPDALLVCLAAYIAMAVGRLHEVFPVLLHFKPVMVSAALAIGLYLLDRSRLRAPGRLRSRVTVYLVCLAVWGALAVPWALNQGVAFHAWTGLVQTVVMSVVIAASLRTPRDVERLTLSYFGASVVYVAVVLSRFELGADSWRLGRLYYYDANDLATLIVTAMPLGLHCFLVHRRLFERLLAGGGLIILAVGLIRSGSRGGFLAFLAVTTFVLVRVTTIPVRSRLAGVTVILVCVLATASDRYWTQMQTMIRPHADYNLTSEEGRVQVWQRGIGYMSANPVFGLGIQNFPIAEGTISPQARRQDLGRNVRWGAAHNTYIQIAAELGIPGLLLFLGLIGSGFAALRRAARQGQHLGLAPAEVPRLSQALMAALVGFVVGAFFLSLAYHDMLYVLLAFALGLGKVARA